MFWALLHCTDSSPGQHSDQYGQHVHLLGGLALCMLQLCKELNQGSETTDEATLTIQKGCGGGKLETGL